MDFIRWGATAEEAKELNDLLYNGGITPAIKRLILTKHFDTTLENDSVITKKFSNSDGLVFRLRVTTEILNVNTIEFRFFFDDLVPKQCFKEIDEKAGLDPKKLSWVKLVILRILFVVYEQLKFFSVEANAKRICNKKTHAAIVWTQAPNGSIGRHGAIN